MNAPPHFVDFGLPNVSISRELGALSDALLAGRCHQAILSFGPSPTRSAYAASRWLERNDRLVRTQLSALAVVVPSFWVRIQWRLFFLLSRPVVRSQVHRTEEKARRWLGQLDGQPARTVELRAF